MNPVSHYPNIPIASPHLPNYRISFEVRPGTDYVVLLAGGVEAARMRN